MAAAVRTGPPNNYKLKKAIGFGAFGEVYQCCDQDTGEEMAVKIVKLNTPSLTKKRNYLDDLVKDVKKEVTILTRCKHDRIVQYFGFLQTNDGFSIFLELMAGGSVADQIHGDNGGALTEPLTLKYTQQIIEGLGYLHSEHVIHRDIKGSNVLRDTRGNVKLADFGVSKQITICTGLTRGVGTAEWTAPEIVNDEKYDYKVDIWSLGCTIVEMITGKFPYDGLKSYQAVAKISKGLPPSYTIPDTFSDKTKKILQETFKISPKDRPSAAELLRKFFLIRRVERVEVPAFWLPQSDAVKAVRLHPDEHEFICVKERFCRWDEIVAIDRIQNPLLHQRYMSKKAQLDKQNGPFVKNERTLWHGTPSENTESINLRGFDPSKYNADPVHVKYRSSISILGYGKGAYFAVKPSTSTFNEYAKPDSEGCGRVYQCKVLVGHSCQGNENMDTPPYRTGTVRYDSATSDRIPEEYVIFHTDHAYPEYLITFKCAIRATIRN